MEDSRMTGLTRPLALRSLILFLAACASGPAVVIPAAELPVFPPTRFAVFSDPHLHTAALGMSGAAFWDDVNRGKKLLHLSEEILSVTAASIMADPTIDFVIIPGDPTKGGELENPWRMKDWLEKLEAAGKKVYVIPGN